MGNTFLLAHTLPPTIGEVQNKLRCSWLFPSCWLGRGFSQELAFTTASTDCAYTRVGVNKTSPHNKLAVARNDLQETWHNKTSYRHIPDSHSEVSENWVMIIKAR
eukprot:3080389-Amphidinium_carterae.1